MENTNKNTYQVTGMGCTSCAARIENILNNKEGVTEAKVNFEASTVDISHTASKESLQESLKTAGYELS